VGLVHGRVTIDDILADRRDDPLVARLSARVRVVPDDDLERLYPERYASIVEVDSRDGRTERERVDWPRGYPQNPLTEAGLAAKLLELAVPVVGEASARRLIELVGRLDKLESLDELLTLCAGSPQPPAPSPLVGEGEADASRPAESPFPRVGEGARG